MPSTRKVWWTVIAVLSLVSMWLAALADGFAIEPALLPHNGFVDAETAPSSGDVGHAQSAWDPVGVERGPAVLGGGPPI